MNRNLSNVLVVLGAAIALLTSGSGVAYAQARSLSPLVNISDPDAFAGLMPEWDALYPQYVGAQEETYTVVNPRNPNNMAATWNTEVFKGAAVGVSMDGGVTWQTSIVPGRTLVSGGTIAFAIDPSLSFAPNGDLYFFGVVWDSTLSARYGVGVNKSTDGGLHWSGMTMLDSTNDKHITLDKPFITADPTDARYAYAVWEYHVGAGNATMRFSRTTDGGATWQPAQTIIDPGSNNQVSGPQIVGLPDGTLAAFFLDLLFSNNNGSGQKDAILTVIRSSDKGQTWSAPIRAASVPSFQMTDPETGVPIGNMASYTPLIAPVAVDEVSGNLYAVWEDLRFSNGQYSTIAFTSSSDGGQTWSAPIQVSKAPTTIPAANRQAFLPSVAAGPDGTIAVSYYDSRFNDAQPGLPTDRWVVFCQPSRKKPCTDPANWGNETRLTVASFDLETAIFNLHGLWLGDYEGLAALGTGFVTTWSQPSGTDRNSIFFRRIGP